MVVFSERFELHDPAIVPNHPSYASMTVSSGHRTQVSGQGTSIPCTLRCQTDAAIEKCFQIQFRS